MGATSPGERANILNEIASRIEQNLEELAVGGSPRRGAGAAERDAVDDAVERERERPRWSSET